MKRIKKTKALALLYGLMSAGCIMAKSHTNFIVILMDDMGYGDIGSNGAIGYTTPHINQMQKEGMTFTRYYAPQAVSGIASWIADRLLSQPYRTFRCSFSRMSYWHQ